MTVMTRLQFSALALGIATLVGCAREPVAASCPKPVTVTNVIEQIREVAVTNVVTVTNAVVERRAPERILSGRKTAPYLLAAPSFDVAQLRKLASDSAARVIECQEGAVALVEASDRAVDLLRVVVSVKALEPSDKVRADVGECVRIVPLSSIDASAVTQAVRDLGGEVVQVVAVGRPAIRAKVSCQAIHKLAERGDVRLIERDEQ